MKDGGPLDDLGIEPANISVELLVGNFGRGKPPDGLQKGVELLVVDAAGVEELLDLGVAGQDHGEPLVVL